MKKRFIMLFAVMTMLLCLPIIARAEIVEQGSCGDNVTYTLDDAGTLTISGEGNVEGSAFSNKTNIQNVVIADDITGIGERAFYGCSNMTSVSIGSGITSIGDAAFEGCTNIKYVNIKDTAKWCTINFAVVHHEFGVYYYSSNPMHYADNLYLNGEPLTELVIPNGTEQISSMAFYNCKSLQSVTIPDSVISIGNWAFRNCSSLAGVEIPGSVESIGELAFDGCSAMTSATLGNGVKNIYRSAFNGCSSLTSITIPESVTSMEDKVFAGCSSLKTVYYNAVSCDVRQIQGYLYTPFSSISIETFVIGDRVESIPTYLLFNCSSLTSLTIGSSLKSVGNQAFYHCDSLESIYVPDLETYLNIDFVSYSNPMRYAKRLYVNNKRISGNVVIPDTVTKIPSYAFHNCDGITGITIPDSVTEIGYGAFDGCSVLKDVYITDLGKWCQIIFESNNANPMYYGANLYVNGNVLTELVIPDGVTNINSSAFYGCKSLTDLTIPDSVTKIDENAFTGCKGLKTLIYNSQKVPDAFNKFRNLECVILGENVTNIDTDAFSGCTGLTNILIPKSVTEIEGSAFKDCSSLVTVYYGGSEAEWSEIYIGANNDCLRNANIKYNSTSIPGIDTPTPSPVPYTPLECNVDYKVEGENITFTVEVKDIARADELKSVQLYTAEFDENGRFTGLTTAKNSAVQDGKITITSHIPQADTYKFFLWDGHFAPLMNVLDNESITTQ